MIASLKAMRVPGEKQATNSQRYKNLAHEEPTRDRVRFRDRHGRRRTGRGEADLPYLPYSSDSLYFEK